MKRILGVGLGTALTVFGIHAATTQHGQPARYRHHAPRMFILTPYTATSTTPQLEKVASVGRGEYLVTWNVEYTSTSDSPVEVVPVVGEGSGKTSKLRSLATQEVQSSELTCPDTQPCGPQLFAADISGSAVVNVGSGSFVGLEYGALLGNGTFAPKGFGVSQLQLAAL